MKRPIKRGEALAVLSDSVHSDASSMWFNIGPTVPQNARIGSTEVVHIRDSLMHHADGMGDSYEDILARVTLALSGMSPNEDGEPESIGDPDAVILRIDSPGGLCSGLNETVFAIRRMARESKIPLFAYVDELAASAAYALACACDEIILPPSAMAGSIGVISAMYDQSAADEKMGIKFVTIKSGTRKDDGHPHVPLTDAAINAEQRRVDRLARQFYGIVASARPITAKDAEALQAGIFLGGEAVTKGLADAVMGWDEAVDAINAMGTAKKPLANLNHSGSNTDTGMTNNVTPSKETRMSLVALTALVKNATAAVTSEKDPKKKKALSATLASYTAALEAYKKEKHSKEVTETEEGDDPEDDDDDKEDGDEEESAETSASEESAEGDDAEESAEFPKKKDKKASSALAALAHKVTGKRGDAAVGALSAMIAEGQRAAAMVDTIAKELRAEKKDAAITAALNARRITRTEATTLRGKPLSFVTSFLEMRPKAIINVDDEAILVPDPNAKPGDGSGLSAEIKKQIDLAVYGAPEGVDRVKLRADMVAQHEKHMSAGLNGAGGRY